MISTNDNIRIKLQIRLEIALFHRLERFNALIKL